MTHGLMEGQTDVKPKIAWTNGRTDRRDGRNSYLDCSAIFMYDSIDNMNVSKQAT